MEYNQNDLLEFLSAGVTLGAFVKCDVETQAVIQLCASGLIATLQARKAVGYEVSTYLLSFSEPIHIQGLVLKIVPVKEKRLVDLATKELALFSQLAAKTDSYEVPQALGAFEWKGTNIFVTELLPGTIATEILLGEGEITRIARAIGHLQQSLAMTKFGHTIIGGIGPPHGVMYYGPKVRMFVGRYCKLALSREEVAFLEVLESLRNASPTIVSDRSPANMLLSGDNIGMYDLGLVLVGVPFEDWSWFIDDPRLVSELTREEMVRIFWDSHESPTKTFVDTVMFFHVSAMFVCIKQYCLMENAGRHVAASHYLQRARMSAESINSRDALALVQKLEPVS